MNSIIRNIRDIDSQERQALEHVLGQPLKENQRVVIQIETVSASAVVPEGNGGIPATKLPEWCNVYEGLTDVEIAEIEKIALSRSD